MKAAQPAGSFVPGYGSHDQTEALVDPRASLIPRRTPPQDWVNQDELNAALKIETDINNLLFSVAPGLWCTLVVGTMGLVQADFQTTMLWAVAINTMFNAALYMNDVPTTLRSASKSLREKGLFGYKELKGQSNFWARLFFNFLYQFAIFNLASAGAMMAPGDFFSIRESHPNFPVALVWIGAAMAWTQDTLLLYTPLKSLLIGSFQHFYHTRCGTKAPTHQELLKEYFQLTIDGKVVHSIPNKSAQHKTGAAAPFNAPERLRNTSPGRIERHLAAANLDLTPAKTYQHIFSRSRLHTEATPNPWFSLRNIRRAFFLAIGAYVMPDLMVTVSGSMHRAAVSTQPVMNILVPWTNMLLQENSIVVAMGGFAMGLFFWDKSAKALEAVFLEIISRFVKYAYNRKDNSCNINWHAVGRWLMTAGIVGAIIPTQLSAMAVIGEGQAAIVKLGGIAANILHYYMNSGITPGVLVFVFISAINASGMLGLFKSGLQLAQLQSSHWLIKPFKCLVNPYTNRQMAFHFAEVARQRLEAELPEAARIQMDAGKSVDQIRAISLPAQASEELKRSMTLAKAFAQRSQEELQNPVTTDNPVVDIVENGGKL